MKTPIPLRQSGISLIVSLVILVVLSMLGLASFRTVSMQERMGAAIYDRNMALQTAESALRAGEGIALGNPALPAEGCLNGVCATPLAGTTERWVDGSFAGWRSDATLDNPTTVAAQFFVEHMGEHPTVMDCQKQQPPEPTCLRAILRVTARIDQQAGNRASVMLQSNVRP